MFEIGKIGWAFPSSNHSLAIQKEQNSHLHSSHEYIDSPVSLAKAARFPCTEGLAKDVEWKEQEIARGSPRKLPDPRAL